MGLRPHPSSPVAGGRPRFWSGADFSRNPRAALRGGSRISRSSGFPAVRHADERFLPSKVRGKAGPGDGAAWKRTGVTPPLVVSAKGLSGGGWRNGRCRFQVHGARPAPPRRQEYRFGGTLCRFPRTRIPDASIFLSRPIPERKQYVVGSTRCCGNQYHHVVSCGSW